MLSYRQLNAAALPQSICHQADDVCPSPALEEKALSTTGEVFLIWTVFERH